MEEREQAPPATIRTSQAPEESSRGAPTPQQKPSGVLVEAVDIAMPPILPIPPESSAAADDCCDTDMAATPAAAALDGGDEELGRSQRDSSSGTADSGNAPAAAKYGAAQSSMPRNFRLSLDGYVLQNDKDGKYAAYRISVTAGLHTWLVLRRYARRPRDPPPSAKYRLSLNGYNKRTAPSYPST